jgi:hypothetical protein
MADQIDYEAEYNRLREAESGWESERATAGENADQLGQWNKWYETHVAGEFSDPKEFTKWMKEEMVNRHNQPNTAAAEAQVAAGPTQQELAYNSALQAEVGALDGDDYMKLSHVQQMLRQQGQDFSNAVSQFGRTIKEDVLNEIQGQVLPSALGMYDQANRLMYQHGNDEGFDMNAVTQYAAENNIQDLDQAFKLVYGDSMHENQIAEARASAAQEAVDIYKQEQAKESLDVARSGYSIPTIGTTPVAGKENWKAEVMQKLAESGAVSIK